MPRTRSTTSPPAAPKRRLPSTRKITGPTQDLPLPHERDENALQQEHHGKDPRVQQADRDLREGRRDTEIRETATAHFNRRWRGKRSPPT